MTLFTSEVKAFAASYNELIAGAQRIIQTAYEVCNNLTSFPA